MFGEPDWSWRGLGCACKEKGCGDGYYLYTWGGEPTFSVVSGGAAASASSSKNIDWNEWHQLAGTNDGSNIRLYVDGVLKGSGPSAGKTGVSDSAYIGYTSSTYYYGVLDDVRIYNRALSEYELRGGVDRCRGGLD
jgi:hypothetical protein